MINVNSTSLRIQRISTYIVLVFFVLLCVVPIWIMLVNATRSTEEINAGISLLPSGNIEYNWKTLTSRGFDISVGFLNSVVVAILTTVLSVYFSTLTAYGLSFYEFKGRNFLMNFIIALITIPPALGIVGFYKYMLAVGMTDTFWPLILPAIAAPSTVFFMRQYIKGVVHKDLVDASRIDGAGEFLSFNRIILPILGPGMATMSIFTFVGSWNAFIAPYILISNKDLYTLPMLVMQLRTDIYRTEFGGIYLGIAITLVPILIFYLLMSRYIISGVTMGAIKE